jgi:hypothetical protein
MSLKGPNSGVYWKDYKIDTPTFQLSSVEKPDLSPFLIHMTGKNQLLSILNGENSPEDIEVPENYGYLKSVIPTFDTSEAYYNSSVVCFTESPIFALDFFRYRSFRRWQSDQQYGIGFSKIALIRNRNVRPVIYLDTNTNTELLSFCNNIQNENFTVTNENAEIVDIKPLFDKIKPLLFPMLEENRSQGFMWEREWRCPSENGMNFPLSAVKVICCPANERDEIIELLGEHAESIEVVESWKEYDDVTTYLKRRKQSIDYSTLDRIDNIFDIDNLSELKQQNDQTFHILSAYYGVFKDTVNQLEGKSISDTLKDLSNTSKIISERIETIKIEIKAKEEQARTEKSKKL